MSPPFRAAAVLGAGTMGAQIAAHLSNAGLPVLLLDVSRDAATQGIKRLRTLKPDPCFVPDVLARITPGSFDEDAGRLRDADWIIEAVVESLDVKQALIGRLATHIGPAAVVSSNTSGIPLAAIASGLPADLRARWLGTHFFNPPRYLHLVELIPTPDTSPDVLARVRHFADVHLGKGVVVARDTPGFIANRIGMFGAMRSIALVASGACTIEELDAISGPIIGRPKSATFRTIDLAGVDIVARVAAGLAERLSDADGGEDYAAPPLLAGMIQRGLIGDKAGRGFYQRVKSDSPDGGSTILVLDPASLDYRAQTPPKLPSLEAARAIAGTDARIRALFLGKDRAGDLLRRTLGPTLLYAARVAPDIAHSPDDVDRAMRWGFGWELGPFETIEAIGVKELLDACGVAEAPGVPAPKPRPATGQTPRPAAGPRRVVRTNAGASLVDLGDDVLCVEFHSKMNTIGGDAIEMLNAGVAEASRNFAALVVGNDAEHFSAGANLMLILLEAQEGNWDEIDAMVRAFQQATSALKYSPVPVVAAPAGLALGGGCEICLHADRVRAAAETYTGLVEVGVGLLPAGGGTKEMLLRAVDRSAGGDAFPAVQAAFETIGFGKVSTSAADARRLGYLRAEDAVTMNRDRVMEDAKRDALARANAGYQPPVPRAQVPVGGADTFATLSLGVHLALRAGRISDHDATIGRLIARILAGGDVPHRTTVRETHLLDLEREAFLKLCGERKTLERMSHTLKTGKTLRN
jgi:3-hydroxyacyl-CoA dehydrogenase